MGHFVSRRSTHRKILLFAAVALATSFSTQAQYARPRGAAPPRVAPPRLSAPPPAGYAHPRTIVAAPMRFGFHRPIFFARNPFFFGEPFFSYQRGLQFQSLAWLTCGPQLRQGLGCNGLPLDENGAENYVTQPPVYANYLYWFGGGASNLVQLYLKDGEAYSVSDYWFVNDQIHFIMIDPTGTRPVEQVLDLDDLDLQATVEVNTRRGFRFVKRDEPLQQYLRDHPDATPPDVVAPPPN